MNALLGTMPSFGSMSASDQKLALSGVNWMAQVVANAINNRDLENQHLYLASQLRNSPFWSTRFTPDEQAQLRNGLALVFANASAQQQADPSLLHQAADEAGTLADNPLVQGAFIASTGGLGAAGVAAWDAYGSNAYKNAIDGQSSVNDAHQAALAIGGASAPSGEPLAKPGATSTGSGGGGAVVAVLTFLGLGGLALAIKRRRGR